MSNNFSLKIHCNLQRFLITANNYSTRLIQFQNFNRNKLRKLFSKNYPNQGKRKIMLIRLISISRQSRKQLINHNFSAQLEQMANDLLALDSKGFEFSTRIGLPGTWILITWENSDPYIRPISRSCELSIIPFRFTKRAFAPSSPSYHPTETGHRRGRISGRENEEGWASKPGQFG